MLKTIPARRRVLVLIGSIGPLGFLPASGTITVAVVGLPLFWLTRGWSTPLYILATAIFTLASVWLHQRGDALLGEKDSRKLVWDEVAGFLIAVTAVPFTWQIALAAFLMQRAIDIAKVPPARWIENRWPGGWGVVGDDVVAGVYTGVILHVLIRLAPGVMGLALG
ncbi:MAG: phosphatidylglycerophosphatase A [Phycisphaerales bacterium]|nr:phosphatidylglycerophosphatase A [Phycisphaerales bacterium]